VKAFKLIFSGGGTGGHIYPALAIAKSFKNIKPDTNFLFVGAIDKMEMEIVPKSDFKIKGLWISGFQRSLSLKNLLFPFKVFTSLLQSLFILVRFNPDAVIGTGGFASWPLLQVAQWLGYPTLIQEQNSYPGIANRILGKKANSVCVAYEKMEHYFPLSKLRLTGNPVRFNMLSSGISASAAKSYFGLDPQKPTLVILGGSLGAKRINELVANELFFFKKHDFQILWQCGALYFDKYKTLSSQEVIIKSFVYEMEKLYTAADIIISRAGAGSLSELSCVGKPLILIPSPNVTANHQFHNAQVLVDKKAAFLLKECDIPKFFKITFKKLVTDKNLQKEMGQNLKAFAKPYSTNEIIKEIMELL
tara:strand:- start:1627 stop:2712 length:1086 start_codon:yes stop_codon:yes gene_type:complete